MRYWIQKSFWHLQSDFPTQTILLFHFYLQKQRSSEELELLKQEMHNTIEYFTRKLKFLNETIEIFMQEEETQYVKGAISILRQQWLLTEQYLKKSCFILHEGQSYLY